VPAAPSQQPAAPARPLLAPLIGTIAWRAEIGSVIAELVANLSPQRAAMVRGVPLTFDSNPNDVNAFAGCDPKGKPFVAATEGLLEAIDAIAQTQATDELFGTHTYEAYADAIAPELVKPHGSSPALPLSIIPAAELVSPQRLSRAHELFDEIAAFTFGHELSHHYLGHTGCAIGSSSAAIDPALLGRILSGLAPGFNQPNELAADSAGVINVLDTGRARAASQQGYRWTEHGGLLLLDFFARMERAAGLSPLNPIGFLQTHPNPALRIPIAQTVARTWWLQHPA
jgi:Zn-dependent protease with chaperone function